MKNLKLIISALIIGFIITAFINPVSIESKTWKATDKAKTFVKETIVLGFFATPGKSGFTEDRSYFLFAKIIFPKEISNIPIIVNKPPYN